MKARSVEQRGRTVEEAVAEALKQLGRERHEVEIEIIDEPNKGFLGLLGGRDAVVRVTEKLSKVDIASDLIREIAATMGLSVEIENYTDDNYVFLNIKGKNLGLLIGRRGQTLDALQYLVNVISSRKSGENVGIILDAEDYRKRRKETLERLATRLAEKVKRGGRRVALEPMNAHERKVIHLALQDDPEVFTKSEGEEPFRRVVIDLRP